MSDLAEFLLARIAEDEAALNDNDCQSLGIHIITVDAGKRWLAECEAKRRIVAIHHPANLKDDGTIDPYASPNDAQWCQGCLFNGVEEYAYRIDECPTKRLLALPYTDHAEFREEWRAE